MNPLSREGPSGDRWMSEKKTILYLDDDALWRKTITTGLREFDVLAVGSVEEFREVLRKGEFKPDLFLIDWLLSPSDEATAETLVEDLYKTHQQTPRIVLTAGRGDEGTVRQITKLKCDYVIKGDLGTIREAIRRNFDIVTATGAPEQSESYYTNSALEVLEKTNKKLEKDVGDLKQKKDTLDNDVHDLEARKLELERKNQQDQFFFERFINVSKSIVDSGLTLLQFADRLLQLLLEFSECSLGVIISFKEKGGLLIDGSGQRDGNESNPAQKLTPYLGKTISVSDIGDSDHLQKLAQGTGNNVKCQIFENFKTNKGAADTFTTTTLAGINRRSHLLLIPIAMNGIVKGVILLFDKRNGKAFDEDDRMKLEQLPLSDILNGAEEMPFRSYDQNGLGKLILKKLFARPWEVKRRILSTAIELLQSIIALIAVFVIVLPGYHIVKYLIKHWWFGVEGHTPHMEILGNIELLLMLLTFVLFSLGLVILFEPKYAQGLPRWMVRFTRLSTLEGTILRLVVIILAVHVLGRFLLADNRAVTDTALELFVVSLSICLITIAVGVFIKYFLHENEDKDDDG